MKDSASVASGPAIPTMLPTTCGEETDLPGVPRVGCVATVSHQPNALHGFSASIIATADSVAILGPDLDQRHRGRHCLFTRHLWRPASLVEAAVAAAGGGQSGAAAGSMPLSSSPSSPLAAAATVGMLSHADGGGVNLIALTACAVSPAALPAGCCSSDSSVQQSSEISLHDMVAVVVAWGDAALQHHVTVLTLHLLRVLSPSWVGYADGSLVHLVSQDALPLPSSQSVLRLFYHPAMTAVPPVDDATSEAPRHIDKHVVLCSLYSPWSTLAGVASGSGGNQHGHVDISGGVGGSGGGAAVERTSPGNSPSTAAGAAAPPRRRGQLLFLTISAEDPADDARAEENGRVVMVTAKPSTHSDVAPWLREFQIDRVVCAFTVQSATTRVIAAAGTTDGRVFVLGPTTYRLARRVSGPVADVIFVRTKPAKVDAASRSAVVDEILSDAMAEDALKNVSFTSAADVEVARRDESEFTALVVLDSAGHLLVLRAVNSGAPITQTVSDLPQVITLANGHKQTLTFVNPSLANIDEEAQISSRNFLDLSSLRHFIGRSRAAPQHPQQPQQPSRRAAAVAATTTTSPGTAPLASSSLTATPVNTSFAYGNGDEPILTGHILSRGLICVANIECGKGGSELIVSTMGQVVVSVPFSPTDGCFRIAGFTVTPAPMFYVGFVDFFANGNPTLVMAGLKNVLIASRSQPTIRERAQLLLRLLSKRERERRHSDTDDGVDG
jgi:hypothetical protein